MGSLLEKIELSVGTVVSAMFSRLFRNREHLVLRGAKSDGPIVSSGRWELVVTNDREIEMEFFPDLGKIHLWNYNGCHAAISVDCRPGSYKQFLSGNSDILVLPIVGGRVFSFETPHHKGELFISISHGITWYDFVFPFDREVWTLNVEVGASALSEDEAKDLASTFRVRTRDDEGTSTTPQLKSLENPGALGRG